MTMNRQLRASAIYPALWCVPLLVLALGSFRQAAIAATVAALLMRLGWVPPLSTRKGEGTTPHGVPPLSTLKGEGTTPHGVPPFSTLKGAWSRLLLACAAAWVAGEVSSMFIPHSLLVVSAVFQLTIFLAAWWTLRGAAVHPPRAVLGAIVLLALVFQAVVVGWRLPAASRGDPAARAALRHPTRATHGPAPMPSALPATTWIEAAAHIAPLRGFGEDAFREAFRDQPLLAKNPLAQLALLGGELKIRADNRAVSLDYNSRTGELAVLREHGEIILISSTLRRLHAFTGELGKAARVRATPDGAGFLCLFEHGEIRYFGADSPFACTGEVKYGMGRAVDLAFDPRGGAEPLVLNAVGALYRIGSCTAFAEITPPLFPFNDQARGLAPGGWEAGAVAVWMLDCHGTVTMAREPSRAWKFHGHAFPPPDDDAVALRAWKNDLLWLDAWGGLHGCHGSGGAAFAYGDLALRVRRGDCVDFVVMPELGRVLVLNGFGDIASYDLARYAEHPNPEPAS